MEDTINDNAEVTPEVTPTTDDLTQPPTAVDNTPGEQPTVTNVVTAEYPLTPEEATKVEVETPESVLRRLTRRVDISIERRMYFEKCIEGLKELPA